MPNYDMKCTECNKVFTDITLRMDELEKYKSSGTCPCGKNSGCMETHFGKSPSIVDPMSVNASKKLPGDFKEAMSRVHEKTGINPWRPQGN